MPVSDFKAHAAGTAYEAAASFTVRIVDEALNEGDEMIVLRAETGFGEVSAEHALTITDDDGPPPPNPGADQSVDNTTVGFVAVGSEVMAEIETSMDHDWFRTMREENRLNRIDLTGLGPGVWSANLTPGEVTNGPTGHCRESDPVYAVRASQDPYDALTKKHFYAGNEKYNILSIRHGVSSRGTNKLHLTLDRELSESRPADLVLNLGSESFRLSDADTSSGSPYSRYKRRWEVASPGRVGAPIGVSFTRVAADTSHSTLGP